MPKFSFLARTFSTPCGYVGVAAVESGLVRIALPRKSERDVTRELRETVGGEFEAELNKASMVRVFEVLDAAERQIREYLAGHRKTFDLPLAPPHATDFMRAVWRGCRQIPYGKTRSYGWLAARIGRPNASRAVGAALGANPLPLIVPCHRVVRGNGSLGGFAGGLPLKQRLLDLERSGRP